jgi:hypothetical protein
MDEPGEETDEGGGGTDSERRPYAEGGLLRRGHDPSQPDAGVSARQTRLLIERRVSESATLVRRNR